MGRGQELAAILACAAAASAGRSRVVWIEGDAGSGKTALMRRALDAFPAGFGVVRAGADELAADVPLAVASQLGPLAAREGFAAGLELLRLFGAWQAAGPVAVAVEDVHWADVASRQALLTAARRLDRDKVVMLLTSRPDGGQEDGWPRFTRDPDRCVRVKLAGLSRDEVTQLAASMGVPLAGRAAERLYRHTRGHPLYASMLLSELSSEQLTASDAELPAPGSLASTILARLAGLPPEARDLACALAVLNRRVPLQMAARVAGHPAAGPGAGEPAGDRVRDLVARRRGDAGRIRPSAVPGGGV